MEPETEVVASPEASAPISTELPSIEGGESIEEQESAASEATEAERTWAYDEWKEHPSFKEWYDDHSRDLEIAARESLANEIQESHKRLRGELVGRANAATTALTTFNSLAAKVIEMEGAEGFARELAKHGVLEAWQTAAQTSQDLKSRAGEEQASPAVSQAVMENILVTMYYGAQAIGDEEMARPFMEQFMREFAHDREHGKRAISKWTKAVYNAGIEAGKKQGLNLSNGINTETRKAEARKDQGPNTETGATGSSTDTAAAMAAYASGEITEAEARRRGVKF